METGVVSKGLLGDVVACAPARKAYTKGETIAKGMNLSNQQEPEQCFKLVAIDGQGRYVSIFDGVTEYKIGETMTQEVRAGHKGGIYVCESMLDLLKLGALQYTLLQNGIVTCLLTPGLPQVLCHLGR